MDRTRRLVIASTLLAVSAFVIALKLIQPASVGVYIGSQGYSTLLTSFPGLYTFDDVLEVFAATLVAGVSFTFILLQRSDEDTPLGQTILNDRRSRWQELSKGLKDDEMKVYQTILDAGGVMNQTELVSRSGLSKATVSRTLDLLESKGLLERRRRGMGNVVLLK